VRGKKDLELISKYFKCFADFFIVTVTVQEQKTMSEDSPILRAILRDKVTETRKLTLIDIQMLLTRLWP
jgi:hypothetical protein